MSLNIPTYTGNTWVDNSSPDLSATNLNKMEQGIKDAVDGVNGLANAVSNQFENDPNKIASAALAYELNGNLNEITPKLLTTLGTFLGTVTRNASTISGEQINVSLTIVSPATSIANDTTFFYINKKIRPVVAPIMIGNGEIGYVFSSVNASNDTVFAARMSAGSIPANTEIYINFNCSIDV